MVNAVDLNRKFYDPMKKFRDMAISGILSNAPAIIEDPRCRNVTTL
jgi:hypothetical protein